MCDLYPMSECCTKGADASVYMQCVLIAIVVRNLHVQIECIPALYTYHTLVATEQIMALAKR